MIYTLGETVLDIIIETFDNVKIKIGGSMLNTAVSLGRLGLDVSHVSYLSEDQVAEQVVEFLIDNHVNTDLLCKSNLLKTNLALAFLDENKNANYSFYKNASYNDLLFQLPKIQQGDVVLFGSFFSLNFDFRDHLVKSLKDAKTKGAFIVYDPNFRKAHLSHLERVKPLVEENIELADLVKGSDEDFELIFGLDNIDEVWNKMLSLSLQHLVYTQGNVGAYYRNKQSKIFKPTVSLNPISTIGAGDTFSAGIIYSLLKNPEVFGSECGISNMLTKAHAFSAQVCMSMDNYLSKEYAKNINNV